MEDFSELNLVGRSAPFLSALALIRKFATCDATALIQGETGTGKELAARAIHYLGERRAFPFVAVNCGALPDSLVENELFGHVRGAFTDARDAQSGLVATAEGGSLFLDEIEALSPKGQVTLLRFIQDGVYRPLGGRSAIAANVRIIAASNTDLSELTRSGAFREDLLYRLAILGMRMPSLRERIGDIAVLAAHFLRRLSSQYRKPKPALDASALELMEGYAWPGNVRELENVLHRQFLLCDGERLSIAEEHLLTPGSALLPQRAMTSMATFSKAKAHAIAEFERTYLQQALSAASGNVTLAARRSGKERRSFGKLLKKHGIDRDLYSTN
ncbi:MAG: sigma-54 interaction domain-containing protein [Burkholderiales bacterium]